MMNKTRALFGTALTLLASAVILDFWPTAETPPAPTPKTPTPPQPPVAPVTQVPGSMIKIGDDALRLTATLSNGYVQAGAENELFLKLDLEAAERQAGTRQPMALAVVFDRSGSMAGEKMQSAREAAKQLAARLTDRDKLTIVTYATDYTVDLPLMYVTAENRPRIARVIDQIFDGGGTNLSGGLEAGLRELRRASADGLVTRLVLLSDGNANQGITNPKRIGAIAARAKDEGISVSSLGVGVDFNEDLMALIAENAGGNYYYAKNGAAIVEALDAEFEGLSKLAARHVELGLNLADGVALKEVYGYRTSVENGRVVISVGDMHGGQTRKVVLRLSMNAGQDKSSVSDIALGYSVPEGGEREFHGELTAVATADASLIKQNERREIVEAAETVIAAEQQRKAAEEFQAGHRERALDTLRRQRARTRARAKALGSRALMNTSQAMDTAMQGYRQVEASSDEGKAMVKKQKYDFYEATKF